MRISSAKWPFSASRGLSAILAFALVLAPLGQPQIANAVGTCATVVGQDVPNLGIPTGLTLAPNGHLWVPFIGFPNGVLDIDPASTGAPVSYPISAARAGAFGSDGNLYVLRTVNRIIRVIPSTGASYEITLPSGAIPQEITSGWDGYLYFTLSTNKIARMLATPGSDTIIDRTILLYQEFPLPTPSAGPNGIALGADGNIWFAESGAQKIGRLDLITTPGAITEYPIIGTTSSYPQLLLPVPAYSGGPASGGAIWFSEKNGSSAVGRLDIATGAITEYPIPPRITGGGPVYAGPAGLALGIDNAIWFADNWANRIGRVDPSKPASDPSAVSFPVDLDIITSGAQPERIVGLADGTIYFTEPGANRIGNFKINTSGLVLNAAPPNVALQPAGTYQDSPRVYTTSSQLVVSIASFGDCALSAVITATITLPGGTTYTYTSSGSLTPNVLNITFPYDGSWTITIVVAQDGVTYPGLVPTMTVTVNNATLGLTPAPAPGTGGAPPTLILPANITTTATGPSGAVVTYTATATSYTGTPITPACTPPSGSTFPIGTTTVTCTATDPTLTSNNTTTGTFTVTVNAQAVPLSLTVPQNVTTTATGPSGATVTYTVSVTGGTGAIVWSCTPPSGSTFPIGTTTVTCTATDAVTSITRTFTVTVNPQQVSQCGPAVVALEPAKHGLEVTGEGSLQVTCGTVVVNSGAKDALRVTGQGSLIADAVKVVGGTKVTSKGTISPAPMSLAGPLADPLAGLATPAAPAAAPTDGKVSGGTVTLQPGLYDKGIDISGKANVTFAPGLYYLRGGGLKIHGQATVNGSGVVFYNTGDKPGSHECGDVHVDSESMVSLSAPASGTYGGILLFNDRACTKHVHFAGGSELQLRGTLYTAGSDLEVHGRSTVTLNSPIIADQVKITGKGNVTLDTRG